MRLHVYVSPKDGSTVLGSIDPILVLHKGEWVTLVTRFGTPAAETFDLALEYANQSGISLLWIDDPNGLFPTTIRDTPAA
jgi:hypothetical protein